ncbi:hypothetical protein BS47DRAFT_1384136 [Hydnum rufescens UP504]|uniref:Uncharacterized protein n=1 Tax=Hydnum rufescens UP504 TaxID=1448309 RepID=A0A9P6DTY8_9AGAM|nr:hypothetical protein BS47DRAFT_1384136 [Hydnum rufescens UP504]
MGSINSAYALHLSIHINPGSEPPRQALSPLSPQSQARLRKGGISPEEVWRETLKTAYGRDKFVGTFSDFAMKGRKIMQYTMQVLLLVHLWTVSVLRKPIGDKVVGRSNIAIRPLSVTRKCLMLFNWLTPLIQITSPSEISVPFVSSAAGLSSPTLLHRFLHAPPPVLLDLFNSVFDDVATFSKLGLVGAGIGRRAGKLADWMWFASTLAGLVEVGAERSMVKGMLSELERRIYEAEVEKAGDLWTLEEDEDELRSQYGWLGLSHVKLCMDLIFVTYNVFELQRARHPVQTFTGLFGAPLSSYKMYESQRSELFKSAT